MYTLQILEDAVAEPLTAVLDKYTILHEFQSGVAELILLKQLFF